MKDDMMRFCESMLHCGTVILIVTVITRTCERILSQFPAPQCEGTAEEAAWAASGATFCACGIIVVSMALALWVVTSRGGRPPSGGAQ